MTQEPEPWREEPSGPQPGGQSFSQNLKHTAIGARVPEGVRAGVFCTGTTILQTSEEFVIDFLSTMVPPQQVAARVAMTPNTFGQMIGALQANLAKYQQQFGRLAGRQPAPGPAQGLGASQEMVTAGGPSGAAGGVGDVTTETAGIAAGAGSGRRRPPARLRPPSRGSRTSTTN